MVRIKKPDRPPWRLELGAAVEEGGVHFRVWAPRASRVAVRMAGRPSDVELASEAKGYFRGFVRDLSPGARYFYVLDGSLARPDPASRSQPEGVRGPSEVVAPSDFAWEDQTWEGIGQEELIIYELHPGTFTPSGDFEAIVGAIDYLEEELGVTALELMPVAQFPGRRNWGYDGVFLFAPQNSYGGPVGLKRLVNACHKRGLAVILDVVYNHVGPEGNTLGDFGPYFTDRYRTPWGQAMNFDGPESDEVRRFIVENAIYWIVEYHLDGLRIDAVHGIFDFGARHILAEIREAVSRQAEILGRRVFVSAESDLNDVRVIDAPRRGGRGLDAQWNDDFHHSLHSLLTGERGGYYQDFGETGQLVKALREGFVYSGQYSRYRKRRHGSSSRRLPPEKFIVFSQNHDQVGNRPKGERLSRLVSFEALKLAAGLVLLSPNIPLLFMGEEYGEEAPFLYFVDHSDEVLIKAVREGRKKEFSSFGSEGLPDPQDELTFLRSKINLALRDYGPHSALFSFYRQLTALRRDIPPLRHLQKKGTRIRELRTPNAVFLRREYGDDLTFMVFNLNAAPVDVRSPIPGGSWERVLDSSSRVWEGPGTRAPESLGGERRVISLCLNPLSFVLYRRLKEGK